MAAFADYLLGTSSSTDGGARPDAVDVAALGRQAADLSPAALVDLAAALQNVMARASFLHGRVCLEAVDATGLEEEDPDGRPWRTLMTSRYRRGSMIADLATACRLTENSIWQRVHRARDLAHDLPHTQVLAAAGTLDRQHLEIIRRQAYDLTPAELSRLDHTITGQPDPMTTNQTTNQTGEQTREQTGELSASPAQPLRPMSQDERSTPGRFEAALRRRVTHLHEQRPLPDQADPDQADPDQPDPAETHAEDQDQSGQDRPGQDQQAHGEQDPAERLAALRAATKRWTSVEVQPGLDGFAHLIITGNAVDIHTTKAALDAAARAGHDRLATLTSWATHALAGLTPPQPGHSFTGTSSRSNTRAPDDGSGTNARPCTAPRPHIVVTIPLSTLTGTGTAPADLAGYGPIPVDLVLDLWRQATIRCGTVDDHGTLITLGHSTYTAAYTPPPRLRRFITAAWQRCAFPGCDAPADNAELDHTTPWPAGDTSECNLRPLCKHHHNLKTHTGWSYRLAPAGAHPPGTLEWTSPTGRLHHSRPSLPELTSWVPIPPPAAPAPAAPPAAAAVTIEDTTAPPF